MVLEKFKIFYMIDKSGLSLTLFQSSALVSSMELSQLTASSLPSCVSGKVSLVLRAASVDMKL